MTSLVINLASRGIINPPQEILEGGLYEVLMGSRAFGTALPGSDRDVYGFFIPKVVSPPVGNEDNEGRFRVINLAVDGCHGTKQYDIVLYPIVRYFEMCVRGYSQLLEMLFVADANLISVCEGAQLIRDARRAFLHQGTVSEFRRFANAQLDDMIHRRRTDGVRAQYIERYGFDLKTAYHAVRLMLEADQLHSEGNLSLLKNSETLLAIRNGKWTEQAVIRTVKFLNEVIDDTASCLPPRPDLNAIRSLFANCLEAEGSTFDGSIADLFYT